MTGLLTGTLAFVFLVLFEIRKCDSLRKGKKRRNPWFITGTALLVLSFILAAHGSRAQNVQFVAGIFILVMGLVLYAIVLSVVSDGKVYSEDDSAEKTCRKGLYGYVRHPGVWSFLLCAAGFAVAFPQGAKTAFWCALLNLGYTWLQDRFFFPVYLEGYEEYKREIPFLFPRLRQKHNI